MDLHGDRVAREGGCDCAFEGDVHCQDACRSRNAVSSGIPEFFGGGVAEELHADHEAKESFTRTWAGPPARQIWFEGGTSAPPLPTDPMFRLETTTLLIGAGHTSAACIGNSLLAYLDVEATAVIVKVSPLKFTLKAQVECQGFRCELKVRVYSLETGHAVEFQRRDGDVFVFASIYQRASSQLMHVWASCDAPFLGIDIPDTEFVIFPPLQFF